MNLPCRIFFPCAWDQPIEELACMDTFGIELPLTADMMKSMTTCRDRCLRVPHWLPVCTGDTWALLVWDSSGGGCSMVNSFGNFFKPSALLQFKYMGNIVSHVDNWWYAITPHTAAFHTAIGCMISQCHWKLRYTYFELSLSGAQCMAMGTLMCGVLAIYESIMVTERRAQDLMHFLVSWHCQCKSVSAVLKFLGLKKLHVSKWPCGVCCLLSLCKSHAQLARIWNRHFQLVGNFQCGICKPQRCII